MESQDRRRQARRRRILEQAESRIKRITGEVEKFNGTPACSEETVVMNGISQNIHEECELAATNRHKMSNVENKPQVVTDLKFIARENIDTKSNTTYLNSTIGTFLTMRLHLILLGIFVCMFFTNTSAFLPFVLLEGLNLIFVLTECEKKSVGILGAILLASGISAEKIAYIFKYMHALSMLKDNLAIYLFSIVISHALLEKAGFSKLDL